MQGWKKFVLLFLATIEILFSAGIIFGWSSISLTLKENNTFSEFCSSDDLVVYEAKVAAGQWTSGEPVCNLQEVLLNLVFSISSFMVTSSPLIWSIIGGGLGPRKTGVVASLFMTAGSFLVAFSNDHNFKAIFPGFLFLAFAGPGTYVTKFHLVNLMPDLQGTIILLFTGAFSSSNCVFLILDAIRSAYDLQQRDVFCGYGVLMFLMLLSGIFVWPDKEKTAADGKPRIIVPPVPADVSPSNVDVKVDVPAAANVDVAVNVGDASLPSAPSVGGGSGGESAAKKALLATISASFANIKVKVKEQYAKISDKVKGAVLDKVRAIMSLPFLISILIYCISELRFNFYLGNANKQLAAYDATEVAKYSNYMNLAMSLSIFTVPILGVILDKTGPLWAMLATQVVGLIFNVLIMYPNLYVQIASFVLFSMYRAWQYGCQMAYWAKVIGIGNVNKVLAYAGLLAGVFNFIQFGLTTLTYGPFGGSFYYVNGFFTFLSCVSIYCLFLAIKRDRQRKPPIIAIEIVNSGSNNSAPAADVAA